MEYCFDIKKPSDNRGRLIIDDGPSEVTKKQRAIAFRIAQHKPLNEKRFYEMSQEWTATPNLDKIIRDHNRRSWIRLIILSILIGIIVGMLII